MAQFTGGCLCGKVRYEASAEPIFQGVCHCKDCQRATGSAFEAVIAIPDASLSVRGQTKGHPVKGESGGMVTRNFCPECGSTLFTRADALPGMVLLLTGPLDDSSVFAPAMQIYCDSAQNWVQLGGDMQKFPRMPPMG